MDVQLKEAYEQMQAQPSTSGSQGLSDESGTDNDSKVGQTNKERAGLFGPRVALLVYAMLIGSFYDADVSNPFSNPFTHVSYVTTYRTHHSVPPVPSAPPFVGAGAFCTRFSCSAPPTT